MMYVDFLSHTIFHEWKEIEAYFIHFEKFRKLFPGIFFLFLILLHKTLLLLKRNLDISELKQGL